MCVGGLGGSLSYLYRIPIFTLSFHSGKNVKNTYLFGPFGGLLTHPLIITGNKQITDKVYNDAQLIINCCVLILKSFDKMRSHFRDICYATRINSTEGADHICNGVKPQSFVFVCTEHLKCLTKIFGIRLNIMFAIAISAALEM